MGIAIDSPSSWFKQWNVTYLEGDHWNVSARVGRCSLSLPSITGNYCGRCWGGACSYVKHLIYADRRDVRSYIWTMTSQWVSPVETLSLIWNWLFIANEIARLDSICCLRWATLWQKLVKGEVGHRWIIYSLNHTSVTASAWIYVYSPSTTLLS